MSFKAELKIAGNTYSVLLCTYSFRRDVDSKGRPVSGIAGGSIEVVIDTAGADTSILESMVNHQYKSVKGIINYYSDDENNFIKQLSFEDGYIVNYTETLDVTGEGAWNILLTISARKIKVGNAAHENDWPEKG